MKNRISMLMFSTILFGCYYPTERWEDRGCPVYVNGDEGPSKVQDKTLIIDDTVYIEIRKSGRQYDSKMFQVKFLCKDKALV